MLRCWRRSGPLPTALVQAVPAPSGTATQHMHSTRYATEASMRKRGGKGNGKSQSQPARPNGGARLGMGSKSQDVQPPPTPTTTRPSAVPWQSRRPFRSARSDRGSPTFRGARPHPAQCAAPRNGHMQKMPSLGASCRDALLSSNEAEALDNRNLPPA